MSKQLSGPLAVNLSRDHILCLEGETNCDLYLIHHGTLMICTIKGSQIIPLAYLGAGEYFGELSFFDHLPRSATVIVMEDTSLVKIPVKEIERQFPKWLFTMAKAISKKIRHADHLIQSHGIKKKNIKSIQSLDMQEQTRLYQLVKKEKAKRNQ